MVFNSNYVHNLYPAVAKGVVLLDLIFKAVTVLNVLCPLPGTRAHTAGNKAPCRAQEATASITEKTSSPKPAGVGVHY